MGAGVAWWWVDGTTYLIFYWGGQAVIELLRLGHAALTGRAPSKGQRSPDQPLRWTEFRKRKALIYTVAVSWMVYLVWTAVSAYCWGSTPNARLDQLLSLLTEPKHVSTDPTCTLIALTLFTAHVVRRLYECTRVSIFSRTQVVNPLGLVRDHLHHLAVGLTLLANSPSLRLQADCVSVSALRWFHLPTLALFYWASKVHHGTHQQFAKLRRNKSGHIVTTGYKQPNGGWFETLNVSCPHYLAELLIHVAVGVALGAPPAPTWWALTAYVGVTQLRHALDTQRFYRAKFEDYPPQRNMIFPYVL